MFINNLIKIHKENGKEMREFKKDIKKCFSDELEFLRFLNKIMNADLDKKKKKKLWTYILNLPSSTDKVILPPNVINRIKEYSLEELREDEYIKDMKWRIWEARQDNSMIENEKIKNP